MKFIVLLSIAFLCSIVVADACSNCETGALGCASPCVSSYESGNFAPCAECIFSIVEPCCQCVDRNSPICNYTMIAKTKKFIY